MSDILRLVVRADAGPDIGSGHVMRCLALAEEWAKHGEVTLVSNFLDTSMHSRWTNAGYESVVTDNVVNAVRDLRPDAIVMDGYHISTEEQNVCMAIAPTLLVDDFGLTRRAPNIPILDGNLVPGSYEGEALCGFQYTLIHAGFGPSTGEGLLITLGSNAPAEILRSIIANVTEGTLVLGAMQDDHEALAVEAEAVGLTVLHDVPRMAEVMRNHSHAIIAGGSTTLEVAACGIPCIVIPFADNQIPVAKAVEQLRIGECVDVNQPNALRNAIIRMLRKEPYNPLVDGRGARRACAWLKGRCIKLHAVSDVDSAMVLEWANDPATRAKSFKPHTITGEEHHVWWADRTSDPTSTLLIGERNGPIGFIWFKMNENDAIVSVNISPERRRQGWGPALIRAATDRIIADHNIPVVAAIRYDNDASSSAFLDAGYVSGDPQDRFPDANIFIRHPEGCEPI